MSKTVNYNVRYAYTEQIVSVLQFFGCASFDFFCLILRSCLPSFFLSFLSQYFVLWSGNHSAFGPSVFDRGTRLGIDRSLRHCSLISLQHLSTSALDNSNSSPLKRKTPDRRVIYNRSQYFPVQWRPFTKLICCYASPRESRSRRMTTRIYLKPLNF